MGAPLAGTVDDDADGNPEVNTEAEVLAYVAALQGNDSHGNPVAVKPVLVRGGKIWYDAGGTLGSFEYHGTPILVESSHPFSVNHNVLPTSKALGAQGCGECHKAFNSNLPTDVFDRLILIDPLDDLGARVYKTVRQLTGLDPF